MKTKTQTPNGESQLNLTPVQNGIMYGLKGSTLRLIPPDLFAHDSLSERKFRSAIELEEIIFKNIKTLFGEKTFLIREKKSNSIFGDEVSPNGYLLDLSDTAKPRFYIVDINLQKQSQLGPLIAKLIRYFLGLCKTQVMEKLDQLISKDKEIARELKLIKAELPGYLTGAIAKPTILFLMDKHMPDLTAVMPMFANNWSLLKSMVIQKYASNGDTVCTVHPPFSELHISGKRVKDGPFTEDYHLEEATPEVKEIYSKVKTELLKVNKQLQFNPQKYYISLKNGRSIAFFHFARKRINLVVKHPEKDTRKAIKHHEIKTLTESVQKFWNGPSCTIVIESMKHLQEIVSLLKRLVKS